LSYLSLKSRRNKNLEKSGDKTKKRRRKGEKRYSWTRVQETLGIRGPNSEVHISQRQECLKSREINKKGGGSLNKGKGGKSPGELGAKKKNILEQIKHSNGEKKGEMKKEKGAVDATRTEKGGRLLNNCPIH